MSNLENDIDEIYGYLDQIFTNREDVKKWLESPHVDLSGDSPIYCILSGKASAVKIILFNYLNGIPV